MVNLNALGDIFSVEVGVFLIVVINSLIGFRIWVLVPTVMERWNERRRDRAAIEAAQYERMDARLQRVEQDNEQCHKDLAAEREKRVADVAAIREELGIEKAERMRLERLLLADGEIRQAKAAVQAELRADPEKAPTTVKRFNGDKGEGK